MDHLSLGGSHEQSGACSEGGILVHEIEEKYLLERQLGERGDGIDLAHEVLVDKLVLCVPFHAVVEALGDGQQIDELQETVESLVEGSDDWLPSG